MKLSIAWIFDHIDADWQTINVYELFKKFNASTAEIEKIIPFSFDTKPISFASITHISNDFITAYSPEWDKEFNLTHRADAIANNWYLIKRPSSASSPAQWVTMHDLGSTKEHPLPAIFADKHLQTGAWKQTIEKADYILEIDNKSITHRPDMWGHRGFAREIAALLNLPLKPISQFIQDIPIEQHAKNAPATKNCPFAITIDAHACSRFAGIFLPTVTYQPSHLPMALRLARIDAKPIDAIVDITNYVMFDLSQPLHAFDASTISSKKIVPRMAHPEETLKLLDGQTITLSCNDLIISDGSQPIALAGIMGGASTAVSKQTKTLFVESACFDATTVRRTATRFKLRTEASARFEKTLDPNQNTQALMRFAQLMHETHVITSKPSIIISCGDAVPAKTIPILYNFLEKRLGVQLDHLMVKQTLEQLEFIVDPIDDTVCTVTVPTFRGSKDITIKEDIVEEIGRFYGYTNIIAELPTQRLSPSPLHAVYQRKLVKSIMTNSLQMHEVENYSFYDEDFLRRLQWEPHDYISVQNPVSENWRRLVTSLLPHLFKSIEQNSVHHDQLRFFEWARTWQKTGSKEVTSLEQKHLAGIFYHKKDPIDFYHAKALLNQFFTALNLPVSWHQVEQPADPWFTPYQTAHIRHNKNIIGTFGIINPSFLQPLFSGFCCAFDIDGTFLLSYKPELKRYVEPSKYPAVERDITALVPLQHTVGSLIDTIKMAHNKITNAELIDCFEKPEWSNARALTFRITIQDTEKTLTKDEVENIYTIVVDKFKKIGATIR